MARRKTFSPVIPIFAFTGLVVLLGAVAVRLWVEPVIRFKISPEEFRMMEEYVNQKQAENGPQLESAKFPSGDALAGVGGNWTYVEQQELTGKEPTLVAGTVPMRQSRLKMVEGDQQLALQEARITDEKSFQAAISKLEVLKVANQDIRLLPQKEGGVAGVLVGQTTILVVNPMPAVDWKQQVPESIAAYIASVRIP